MVILHKFTNVVSTNESILFTSRVQVDNAFAQVSIIIGMQITVWWITGRVTLHSITGVAIAHHQQLIGLIVAFCSSTKSFAASHKTGNKLIEIASIQLSRSIDVCDVQCRCDNHQKDEKCYD